MGDDCERKYYRGGDVPTAVDIDTALKLLSNPPRRHMIRELASQPSDYLPFDELMDLYVNAHPESVDPETVEVEIHHSHIPALAKAGLVEYDEKSGDVRYYSNPFVEEVLDVIEQYES